MDEGDGQLIRWLEERDVACPICAYNLRDLKAVYCPECGGRLRLHVGSDNMKLGAWFLGVLGLSLALGFDGVITTLMIGVFIMAAGVAGGAHGGALDRGVVRPADSPLGHRGAGDGAGAAAVGAARGGDAMENGRGDFRRDLRGTRGVGSAVGPAFAVSAFVALSFGAGLEVGHKG